jgi:polyhydroxybutyrate depolymerase
VNALLDEVMARYPVDRHRMYATGFSNGASMAFRVGRELAGRIAAIAPASGSDWLDQPSVSRPVPLLYITGTDDPLNPLEGGEQKLMRRTVGTKPPVDEQLGKWVTMLGCPPVPEVVRDSNGVRGVAYGPCREGSEVLYYTVEGMGHAWAGGKSTLPQWMVGKTSEKIKANDLIWDFFKRHVRK